MIDTARILIALGLIGLMISATIGGVTAAICAAFDGRDDAGDIWAGLRPLASVVVSAAFLSTTAIVVGALLVAYDLVMWLL